MAKTDIDRVRKVLLEHEYEIAAELGLGDETHTEADSPRNANTDPQSPLAARTGRIVSRAELGFD